LRIGDVSRQATNRACDSDGVLNDNDLFPFDAAESSDSDCDFVGDVGDPSPADSGVSGVVIEELLHGW
ncbi:MAG: hypothetical protein WCL44_12500, partial [bacterium]